MTRETDIRRVLADAIHDSGPIYDYDIDVAVKAVLEIADNLMTPIQVAEYLAIPRTSVQRLYRRPTNGNMRIEQNTDGRSPQFYRPDVLEWARQHQDKITLGAPVVKDLKRRTK